MSHSPLKAARYYLLHGFYPIPVPFREKAPVVKNWPNLHLTEPQLGDYFNGEHMNIGVLLGAPRGNNDIDLDAFEALRAWPEFSLDTGMIWGRSSKPASHWMYRTEPVLATVKFPDPTAPKDQKSMLLELRGPGAQTIMPPSEHPTGEAVEFMRAGEPALVDRTELLRATRRTAACALLARYLPGEGQRHDFFLAIAGGLRHARWPVEETAQVLRAIYRAAWGAEADLRRATLDATTTYQSHEQGKNTTGWPSIESMLDRRVLNKALEWLGIERPAPPRPAPQVRKTPREEALVLYNADYPPPDPIVDPILYPGLTILGGRPKVGKSWFALQLALAVVSGQKLAGYLEIKKPGRCLYVSLEDHRARIHTRLHQLSAPSDFLADLHFLFEVAPLFNGGAIALDEELQEHPIEVLIIDSLLALVQQAKRQNVDIMQADYNIINTLRQIAQKHSVALVVVAHTRKAAGDFLDLIQGTTGTTAATDSVWVLQRSLEGSHTLSVTGREIPFNIFGLKRTDDSPAWLITGEGDEVTQSEARRDLLELLREGPLKPSTIAQRLHKNISGIHRLLNALGTSNQVVRTSHGTYMIAPPKGSV